MFSFLSRNRRYSIKLTQDYKHLPPSLFRSHRAQDIYARYFISCAPRYLPIEKIELEELIIAISEEIPETNIFNYFQNRAYSFLEIDSYPSFVRYSLQDTIKKAQIESNYEQRKRYFTDGVQDNIQNRIVLENIFQNCTSTYYFKLYTDRINYSQYPSFYMDAAEFNRLFSNLTSKIVCIIMK